MVSNADSVRFEYLRFPLIVGVIYIHTLDIHGAEGAMSTLDFVREVVSQGLARLAVPLFFLMSGYFFFGGKHLTKDSYAKKIAARARTLLIPFLFWNLLALGIFSIAQAVPAFQKYFSGATMAIADYGAIDYTSAIFGINRPPIAYQFWFIRDLMLLAIATPLIDHLLKNFAWATISTLVICWLLDIGNTNIPSIEATLFFAVGALASTRGWSVFFVDRFGKLLLISYPALLLIDSLNIVGKFDPTLHHVTVAVGICAALHLTSFIHAGGRIASVLLKLAGSSFFVYAAHEPLLTIARKLSLSLLRNAHESALVLLYFALPILLAGLLVLLYRILSAGMPSALSFVSGGRK